ncbi:MAG: hypothetical protein IJG50_06920 [Clostridia bacterium]|nr:hypothetical protein [Clostridia bacterium]
MEQELKRLYRKIVKAMHPDLHPNQDEATKELFKKAIIAYKERDIQTLSEIEGMFEADVSADAGDLSDTLITEKQRLIGIARHLRSEIKSVKNSYMYSKKEMLADPAKREAEKQRLRESLEYTRRSATAYRDRIEELKKNA